jgi:hypothetical protein
MISSQDELEARLERAYAESKNLRRERSVLLALAEKNLAAIRTKEALASRLCAEAKTRLQSSQQDLEKAARLLADLTAL